MTALRERAVKPRIVIVGGGFSGAYCAQELERKLRADEGEIVLIDRQNFFVFSPLLVEAGSGNLEPRHVVVSIRSFLKRARFVLGEVFKVDFENQLLLFRRAGTGPEETIAYDHLVLAPGSVTRLPDVQGLGENGFEIKSLQDAIALRDRAIRQLELADLERDPAVRRRMLHFVVVGANFTGTEVAGEFDVYLRRAGKLYRNIEPNDIAVTLVEIGERILPALDEDLANYARQRLEARGVRIELESSISSVAPDHVVLSDGRTLETETVIWCAGIAPSPLISELDLPTDERGYVVCDPELRVRGQSNVWAIGDSAVNVDSSGAAYPATAQHAVQQGVALAENIARVLRGKRARACEIKTKGSLAALGCRTGVARVFGIKLSGFAAWFLWRTVYLMKMPGLARRVRVALDWTIDLVFPPDVVALGLASARRSTAMEDPPRETVEDEVRRARRRRFIA